MDETPDCRDADDRRHRLDHRRHPGVLCHVHRSDRRVVPKGMSDRFCSIDRIRAAGSDAALSHPDIYVSLSMRDTALCRRQRTRSIRSNLPATRHSGHRHALGAVHPVMVFRDLRDLRAGEHVRRLGAGREQARDIGAGRQTRSARPFAAPSRAVRRDLCDRAVRQLRTVRSRPI